MGLLKKEAILSDGRYTNKLTFSYTIKEGDFDDNGISILKSAGKLIEYADTDTLITDLAGNPLNREYSSTLSNDNFDVDSDGINPKVNYKIDAVQRVITDFKIEGSGNQYQNTYGVNSVLSFTYTFNHSVKIIGSPKLKVKLGINVKTIEYHSGSNTNKITFQYTVIENDNTDSGVEIPADPFVIDDTNKLISSVDGRDAVLNPRPAVPSNSDFKINAVYPTITTIDVSGSGVSDSHTQKDKNSRYFKNDNVINITVNFSKPVVISPYTNCKLFILTDKFTTNNLPVQPFNENSINDFNQSQIFKIKINTAMGDSINGLSIYRSPSPQTNYYF